MKTTTILALAACAALGFATAPFAADGPPAPRKERVTFAKGASSATIKGTLKGGGDVDYLVRAAAGQTLEVKFQGTNSQNDFNVLPPGSANVAMYVSSMTGERSWSGMLPADGDSVGELQVRGPWVTASYHGGVGAEKFDDGWLRTGDMGTVDPAGAMKITDRLKDLIKSGGEWISSTEIEHVLTACAKRRKGPGERVGRKVGRGARGKHGQATTLNYGEG